MFPFKEKKDAMIRWLLYMAIIFFVASIPVASYAIYEKIYENRSFPGIYMGAVNLGGKTEEEIKTILNKEIDELSQSGITFYYENNQTTVFPIITSIESDLAYRVIDFKVDDSAKEIMRFGRNGNYFNKTKNRISSLIAKKNFSILLDINEVEIKKALMDRFSKFELPTANASLSYEKDSIIKEKINFKVEKEKLGKIINYDKSLKILKDNLGVLNNTPITLYSKNSYPEIYLTDTLNSAEEAEKIITIAPVVMIYEDKNWEITKEALADLLEIKIKEENDIKKTYIGLSSEKFTQYLDKNILPEINQPPIDAKFELKEGRVTEFIPSQDGLKVDIEKSLTTAEEEIINNKNKKINLFVIKDKSKISIKDINDLGIQEIIGTGKSNFAGSPSNRRHNIKVGANSLNGLLIKPGEEFSLIKALGNIDASSGYLPELVIKDNKTIPEYGGGLCQIGTTVFRGALETGLPITLRRNHSYRVAYYEPAGTDATIYDPWPDLRFINDSDKHILIQSRIEGDDIYFDFWGTKDGRIIEKTDPVIYNIVKPGPTKLIETLDLAPGVKRCTERAHNGADAYFDYKVIYADGKIKEERFASHYVPWREVCLIGVEKLTEEIEEVEKIITE